MSERSAVILNGHNLTVEDIVAIGVGDKTVELEAEALTRCKASRTFLENEIAAKRIIYGVNTSFGPMCNKIIQTDDLDALQVNLIRSHAAGLGAPLEHYVARSVLAIRLNTLARGYSGVRVELLHFMKEMINAGIAPYIPEAGGVGASGDLIQLAHNALAIIGEGQVYMGRELMSASEALKKAGLVPFQLRFKEGIALINGTSAMTAVASFAVFSAKKLLRLSCVTGAFALEIFGGIDDAFDPDLHAQKPHPGQVRIAALIRRLYAGSRNITLREGLHERINDQKTGAQVYETTINVQDVYSIRCTPQILAPVSEALEHVARTVEVEANSSNDNPIVVPEQKKTIHGGNFHGQSIAFAMDMLCMALAEMGTLSERRVNKLLDKKLNEGLPEHLIAGTPGLTVGFMGMQYLATSSTAELRQLANPIGTLSISCNASNQDVVSMGCNAARKAMRAATMAKHVLTVEILCDLQALSFRNATGLAPATRRIYEMLSKEFPVYHNERVLHDDLVRVRKLLFSSQLFDDLEQYCAEGET